VNDTHKKRAARQRARMQSAPGPLAG
jgi:hypothetical protein